MPSAWDALLTCPLGRCNYRCGNGTSRAHLLRRSQSAATGRDALQLLDLTLPPGANVLLFGTSYTRQIFEGILCANRLISARDLSGQYDCADRYTKYHFDPWAARVRWRHGGYEPPPCGPGGTVTGSFEWFQFANNSNVTVVTNFAPLQERGQGLVGRERLRRLLRHGRFSHVFYSTAWPDCFFDYQRDPHKHEPCVDLSPAPGSNSTSRMSDDDRDTWNLFEESARTATTAYALHKVLPWAGGAASNGVHPTGSSPSRVAEVDIPTQRDDSERSRAVHTIDAEAIMAAHGGGCRVPDCAHKANGHQCFPSALAYVSAEVVRHIRRAQGFEGANPSRRVSMGVGTHPWWWYRCAISDTKLHANTLRDSY